MPDGVRCRDCGGGAVVATPQPQQGRVRYQCVCGRVWYVALRPARVLPEPSALWYAGVE